MPTSVAERRVLMQSAVRVAQRQVDPETLVQACQMFRERNIRIDQLYHRKEGVFPGRELYFFDPSGNRLELRDPTWKAGMPEPTFEELASS